MVKLLKLSLLAVFIVIIAFILIIFGVVTEGWDRFIFYDSETSYGLQVYKVVDSTSISTKGQAAHGLCVVSTLGAAVAVASCIFDISLQISDERNKILARCVPLVSFAAAALGGITGMVGSSFHVAVMTSTYSISLIPSTPYSYRPNYSFYLTIFGCIILVLGGGLAFKSQKSGYIHVIYKVHTDFLKYNTLYGG